MADIGGYFIVGGSAMAATLVTTPIVRSIARHHGGDVALLASDHGARFCLTLPVHLDTNRHQPLTEGPLQPS